MSFRTFVPVVFLLSMLAATFTVRAADLPVSYLVDEKALKAAVAGTALTFELHTDRACTSPIVVQAVLIEQVDVVSRLKRVKAKQSPDPPKTTELRHTLADVPSLTPLYRVTGTGVTPLGSECQVQAAGVAGPPGPTGLEGPYCTPSSGCGTWDTLRAPGAASSLRPRRDPGWMRPERSPSTPRVRWAQRFSPPRRAGRSTSCASGRRAKASTS